MDEFKRNAAKSKMEAKIVIALVVLLPVIGLLVVGHVQYQNEDKAVERYLEQERPDVVLALKAYKAENGRYPDSISDAVTRYYKGRQDRLFFLERYEYRNFGTNFFLNDFNIPR